MTDLLAMIYAGCIAAISLRWFPFGPPHPRRYALAALTAVIATLPLYALGGALLFGASALTLCAFYLAALSPRLWQSKPGAIARNRIYYLRIAALAALPFLFAIGPIWGASAWLGALLLLTLAIATRPKSVRAASPPLDYASLVQAAQGTAIYFAGSKLKPSVMQTRQALMAQGIEPIIIFRNLACYRAYKGGGARYYMRRLVQLDPFFAAGLARIFYPSEDSLNTHALRQNGVTHLRMLAFADTLRPALPKLMRSYSGIYSFFPPPPMICTAATLENLSVTLLPGGPFTLMGETGVTARLPAPKATRAIAVVITADAGPFMTLFTAAEALLHTLGAARPDRVALYIGTGFAPGQRELLHALALRILPDLRIETAFGIINGDFRAIHPLGMTATRMAEISQSPLALSQAVSDAA
ncbi:hypothetical protein [Ketogulonicigenium vulgare]|uniref:hypothetical protein n=1 Tax=Ketogulonicigenium vulgare TaxID=92945 RepID=UPI0023590F85|nr:hypothetical protein [Ketogulonicigenium vulgare]